VFRRRKGVVPQSDGVENDRSLASQLQASSRDANFTTLKHMAYNLIRRAPGKDSLRLKRKVAAWDDDFLASLLTA
jgi:hypothetical protein